MQGGLVQGGLVKVQGALVQDSARWLVVYKEKSKVIINLHCTFEMIKAI